MPLSDHEQRMLDQIESALYAEDPKFASSVRGAHLRTPSTRRRLQGVGLFLLGLAMLVSGVAIKATMVGGFPVLSVLGFVVMFALVGFGLMRVFDAYPAIYPVLKIVSVFYLAYLAWKIATAAGPGEGTAPGGHTFSFLQAALFQWVNPKAWAVALTVYSVYSPSRGAQAILVVSLVFFLVTLLSVTVWTLLGQQLRKLLTNKLRLRVFNGMMGALLIASLLPVLLASLAD